MLPASCLHILQTKDPRASDELFMHRIPLILYVGEAMIYRCAHQLIKIAVCLPTLQRKLNARELQKLQLPGHQKAKEVFRIGELNPGLVGTDYLSMTESDKS